MEVSPEISNLFNKWRSDWNLFARQVLKVNLDPEQEEILTSVQNNKMTSVASGTARGKDFVAAVAAMCFLYLTPRWNEDGELIENTKVAMTAPTDRQVGNIMFPEIARMFNAAKFLPGRLTGYDIRTENKEWFLTGFKADAHQHEAWSGFHAVNTMFVITEATGISENIFSAIEGNLQGNSRILLVFNPNISTGYAANSQKSDRWIKFRLDSLTAPNVLQKKIVIPAQVDYEWVKDKVQSWSKRILKEEFKTSEGDFEFEGEFYRPNDLFRVKVRGMFPKVSEDVLVPPEWITEANKRWTYAQTGNIITSQGISGTPAKVEKTIKPLRLGNDVAGMGRDASCFAFRYDYYVDQIKLIQSAGEANHMQVAGIGYNILKESYNSTHHIFPQIFIDTIGEGAGVYSRLLELADEKGNEFLKDRVHSCKFSEASNDGQNDYTDATGVFKFLNMRAYAYWSLRDWLNPDNKIKAMLPPNEKLFKQLTETKWFFRSDGKIQIEAKEDLKARLGYSPDEADALANTFWPIPDVDPRPHKSKAVKIAGYFQ